MASKRYYHPEHLIPTSLRLALEIADEHAMNVYSCSGNFDAIALRVARELVMPSPKDEELSNRLGTGDL